MEPFRPLVIDNRQAAPQFLEGNPLTDGMANFASSLINAPAAADQTRRQVQAQQLQQLFQQHQDERAQQELQLRQLWHDGEVTRQADTDAYGRAKDGIVTKGYEKYQPLADQLHTSIEERRAHQKTVDAELQAQTAEHQTKGGMDIASGIVHAIGSYFGGGSSRHPGNGPTPPPSAVAPGLGAGPAPAAAPFAVDPTSVMPVDGSGDQSYGPAARARARRQGKDAIAQAQESLATVSRAADAAPFQPAQRLDYKRKQLALHQLWQQALQSGDAAGAARARNAIDLLAKALPSQPAPAPNAPVSPNAYANVGAP